MTASWNVCVEVLEPMLKEAHEQAGGFNAYKDMPMNGGSKSELQATTIVQAVYDCVPSVLKPSADGALPTMHI